MIAVGIKNAVHSELMLMATNSHLVHETKTFKEKFEIIFWLHNLSIISHRNHFQTCHKGLDSFIPQLFNDICEDGIGGETFSTTTSTTPGTTTRQTTRPKLDLPKALVGYNCHHTEPHACSMKLDLAIILDANQNLAMKNNPWQKFFAKRLITEFDMDTKDSVRITVSPISQSKQSMTASFDDAMSSDKLELCHFVHKLRPSRDKKYRGDHFFEGLYPVMAPIYFGEQEDPERKRVMVIIKHLTEDAELEFSETERSKSYWSGNLDEPEVFVVAVGHQHVYTAQIDRLLRLAGSPSRLLFIEPTWDFEEVDALVPLIRKRICALPRMPATTRAPITPPKVPECFEEEHTSWEAPVCCAQLDLFVGFQVSDSPNMTSSLKAQIELLKKVLDGFIVNEDYLLVSVGLLNNGSDLVQVYENEMAFSGREQLIEKLDYILDHGVEVQTGSMIEAKDLEVLNRNEFFAKRYATRSNADKLSIIFRGDDDEVSTYSDFDYDARGIRPDYQVMARSGLVRTIVEKKADFQPFIIPGLEGHPIYGISYANFDDADFKALINDGTEGKLLEVENYQALDRYVNTIRKNLCELAGVPISKLPPKPPVYAPELHIVVLLNPGAMTTEDLSLFSITLGYMIDEVASEVIDSEWGQEAINHPEIEKPGIPTFVHLYGAGVSVSNSKYFSIDLDNAINQARLGSKTPKYQPFLFTIKDVMTGLNGPEGQFKPSKLLIMTFGSNEDYNNMVSTKNPLYRKGDFEPTENDGEITDKISWIHFDIDDCRSVRDISFYDAPNVARVTLPSINELESLMHNDEVLSDFKSHVVNPVLFGGDEPARIQPSTIDPSYECLDNSVCFVDNDQEVKFKCFLNSN